jgi:hypothetical protein
LPYNIKRNILNERYLMSLIDKIIDDEYYKFYLSKHQNSTNRYMHVIGNIFTIFFIIMVISSYSLLWLLLAPFIVYPFAFLGHIFFEGSIPALFSSNPIKAKLADIRMCYNVFMRKL